MVLRLLFPVLFLVLLTSLEGVNAARWGSGSAVDDGVLASGDLVPALNAETFNSSLLAAPANWALVEFYANWCPACKKYKPHFERVARLFTGPNRVHEGVVYFAKVDCADQASQKLCERFSIRYYPSLLWALPPVLAIGSRSAKIQSPLEEITNAQTAEALLEQINKRIGKSFSLSDATTEDGKASGTNTSEPLQMPASLHDVEEATAQAFKIIVDEKMLVSDNRGSFIQFLMLLVVHHPSERCRKGSANLLVNLAELWPAGQVPTAAFLDHPLCGPGLPRNFWVSCRGERRGYSCGLWLLFHSLSVRVADSESAAAFSAIHSFVEHFFNCQECRQHFLEMISRKLDVIASQEDLVLWLWHAHNEVNMRLAKEEEVSKKWNPNYPKVVWPTRQQCSECRVVASVDKEASSTEEPEWAVKAVYKFLKDWYGASLLTLPDTIHEGVESEGQIAVSRGGDESGRNGSSAVRNIAAVAILLASCGFGLVALWWRMQQKKRKRRRRRI